MILLEDAGPFPSADGLRPTLQQGKILHPILLEFGSFRLPTYGALVALAMTAAVYTVVRLGRREGLDTARLFDFSTWLIIVALVGAKALLILTDWSFYWQHPGEIFSWATLQAGGVFYGGFIAAVFFAVWYVRVHRLHFWKVFDVYSPAIALGLGIGRLGCFSAGCDYGKPTTSFLGVVFTNTYSHDLTGVPLGVALHPTQLYESFAVLTIFSYLVWRFRHKSYEGQIFLHYLALYAVARFLIEFLRGDDARGFVFDHLFSTSQFIALLALGTAAALAWHFHSRRDGAHLKAAIPEAKHARG